MPWKHAALSRLLQGRRRPLGGPLACAAGTAGRSALYSNEQGAEALVSELERKVIQPLDVPVFIASFTTEGDQLSQWRAYTRLGDGFSIGFAKAHAEPRATAWAVGPVQYEPATHDAYGAYMFAYGMWLFDNAIGDTVDARARAAASSLTLR